jgi:CBS domain-containing protein
MNIGAICNRQMLTARGVMTVLEAAKCMRAFREPIIVVTEEKDGRSFAAGVVTDREVAAVVAGGGDPSQIALREIMRISPGFVTETDSVFDTVGWMHWNHLREVVVHDEGGRLVGVVTIERLFENMAPDFAAAAVRESDDIQLPGQFATH